MTVAGCDAGSDSVFLCTSPDEVQAAFARINGQFNGLGQVNDGALCQEFLEGTEYVIDGVSRDGVYKVRRAVGVWRRVIVNCWVTAMLDDMRVCVCVCVCVFV